MNDNRTSAKTLLLAILLPVASGLSFLVLVFRPDSAAELEQACLLSVVIVGPLWAAVGFLAFMRNGEPRGGRLALLMAVLAYLFSAGGLSLCHTAVYGARTACSAAVCMNKLCAIGLALQGYHAAHGCFPPAYIADAQGKPMHSWRVLILPYLEQQNLYNAYHFDEPWDGPHNRKLAAIINGVFQCPSDDLRSPMTSYVAIVGDRTAFPGSRSSARKNMPEGRDVILVVEIKDSDINWAEPRDLRFDAMSFQINDKTKPSISSPHFHCAHVLMASRRLEKIEETIPAEVLKALITIDGGEGVTIDRLQALEQ